MLFSQLWTSARTSQSSAGLPLLWCLPESSPFWISDAPLSSWSEEWKTFPDLCCAFLLFSLAKSEFHFKLGNPKHSRCKRNPNGLGIQTARVSFIRRRRGCASPLMGHQRISRHSSLHKVDSPLHFTSATRRRPRNSSVFQYHVLVIDRLPRPCSFYMWT